MTFDLRRELRLLAVLAAVLAIYAAAVASYAAMHGQLGLLRLDKANGVMVTIWITALTFAFCAYAIDLVVRRRPARPLMLMLSELREQVVQPYLLLARGTVVVGWLCLMIFFSPFKVMIGHTRGFPYDAALERLDRLAFGGVDPWQVTHALFGGPVPTFLLQMAYNMWFVMMWVSIIYITLRPELVRLRARYILSFVLTWIIVGSVAAYFLASAGPCYYERAFGDPHFRPLMQQLEATHAELKAIWPGLGVPALRLQDLLWTSFTADRQLLGGGISAMPSMHVAVAVLMACAGWQMGRRTGWLLSAYAFVIWIGSIHLGWHYALDGVVALGFTLAIWKLSGRIVDGFVLREPPAAAWRPALAE